MQHFRSERNSGNQSNAIANRREGGKGNSLPAVPALQLKQQAASEDEGERSSLVQPNGFVVQRSSKSGGSSKSSGGSERSSDGSASAYSTDEEEEEHLLTEEEIISAMDYVPEDFSRTQSYFHLATGKGKKQAQKKLTTKGLKATWDQRKVFSYRTVDGQAGALEEDAKAVEPDGEKKGIFIFGQLSDGKKYRWLQDGEYDFDSIGHGSMVTIEEEEKIDSRDKSVKVDFAGQFTTVDGDLKSWDNKSGHFAPPDANRSLVPLPQDLYKSNLTDTVQVSMDVVTVGVLCALGTLTSGFIKSDTMNSLIPESQFGYKYPRTRPGTLADDKPKLIEIISGLTPESILDIEEFFEDGLNYGDTIAEKSDLDDNETLRDSLVDNISKALAGILEKIQGLPDTV